MGVVRPNRAAPRLAGRGLGTRMRLLSKPTSRTWDPLVCRSADPVFARPFVTDCVLPGQACSYKVGQLSILKLRAVLQAQLGAAFDVRAFHRCLLEGGGIPVAMLAQVTASLLASAEPQPQPAAKA